MCIRDRCIGWLRSQVKLINPKIIVCLGRIAAAKLIKPDIKITKEHGIDVYKRQVLPGGRIISKGMVYDDTGTLQLVFFNNR